MIHPISNQMTHQNSNQAQYEYNAQIPAQYYYLQSQPMYINRQNIIILDWDDTLFPRHELEQNMKAKTVNKMETLSITTSLRLLFEQMIKIYGDGNIYILTNGSYKWIYNSCPHLGHFGSFIQWIQSKNIQIISAKCEYQATYPNEPQKWKECAFENIYKKHFKNANDIHCVTSIGDRMEEFYASQNAAEKVSNCILHRIKFREYPSMNDLVNQINWLAMGLNNLCCSSNDISVAL